jgi:hypothetical protein
MPLRALIVSVTVIAISALLIFQLDKSSNINAPSHHLNDVL